MVIAKFSGTCPDCRMPIRIGDKLGKHNGRWAHIQCPPRQQPRRFEDPMAQFDAEIQRRENEADQAAEEAKMDREMRGIQPGYHAEDNCHAPRSTRYYQRTAARCGKPLGPLESFAPQYHANQPVRRCAEGHVSFLCPSCRRLDFAVMAAPPAEHETIVTDYRCRHCGESVWSDEGIDGRLGEIQ